MSYGGGAVGWCGAGRLLALVLAMAIMGAGGSSAQGGSSLPPNAMAAGAPASEGVVLHGQVTRSPTGEELSGVAVELVELRQRRLTDARGRFWFVNVPAGT
jgi:hypothetical protein